MSLEKQTQIPELYDFRHRNDNLLNTGYKYQNNLFRDNISPHMYKNQKTSTILSYIETLVLHMMQSNVLIRNWFNHNVSKYYDGHNR